MKLTNEQRGRLALVTGVLAILFFIAFLISLAITLTSCTCGFGGGGFSLDKFFGNPIIIVLIIAVIIWMYFKSKKS